MALTFFRNPTRHHFYNLKSSLKAATFLFRLLQFCHGHLTKFPFYFLRKVVKEQESALFTSSLGDAHNKEVDEVTVQCAKVNIDEDGEEEVIQIEDNNLSGETLDLRWALMGKFLTNRVENAEYMKRVMTEAWKPGMGVSITEIALNLFLIQFGHEADVRRVIEGGPWSYNNNILLLERVNMGEDIRKKDINSITLWLQAYDVPDGCMSEKVAQLIGNSASIFVEADSNNFTGFKKSYMRIRVKLNVNSPIKQSIMVKSNGTTHRVSFKYERLPTYCYGCGIMGHSEKLCSTAYLSKDGIVEQRWNTELRASPKGNPKLHAGERWLRTEPMLIPRAMQNLHDGEECLALPGQNIGNKDIDEAAHVGQKMKGCMQAQICQTIHGKSVEIGHVGSKETPGSKGAEQIEKIVGSCEDVIVFSDPKRKRVGTGNDEVEYSGPKKEALPTGPSDGLDTTMRKQQKLT